MRTVCKCGNQILAVISFGLMFSNLYAQPVEQTTSSTHDDEGEVFHQGYSFLPPEPEDLAAPYYPVRSAERGREGWVVVNYMVDIEGNPYEPTILASSGDSLMEQSAFRALEKSTFQPAKLNDELVDASMVRKYTYQLANGVGASFKFRSTYVDFNTALDANELEEARQLLIEMEAMASDNLYEDAFYNLSRYFLAEREEDLDLQLKSLNHAVSYSFQSTEHQRSFLPEEMLPTVLARLYAVEVRARHYGEAVSTLERMISEDFATAEDVAEAKEQLEELRTNDIVYSVGAEIGELLGWNIQVHKKNFYISDLVGNLAELKLRCEGAYRVFSYQEDAEYSIPDSWGSCILEVIGDPGTTFSLVQAPAL